MSSEQSIKCFVVGDTMVGKTSAILSHLEGFPSQVYPTVFDTHTSEMMCDGVTFTLNLWEIFGFSDYDRMRPLTYPKTDVFLICFSVVSPSSFENAGSKWYPEIMHNRPYAPIILVATKIDLREDKDEQAKLKEQGIYPIKREQGQKLASKIRAVKYLECSALTQKGLKEVFDEAVRVTFGPKLQRRCRCQRRKCVIV